MKYAKKVSGVFLAAAVTVSTILTLPVQAVGKTVQETKLQAQVPLGYEEQMREEPHAGTSGIRQAAERSAVPPGSWKTEGDFSYIIQSDGTAAIYRYGKEDTSVVIPSKIGGRTVTAICDEAFLEYTKIKNVTIPKTVTHIGDRAFDFCTSLKKVVIPESVISIGENAFAECRSLVSISIPKSVKSIGAYAFVGCDKLKELKISSKNKTYMSENGLFYNKKDGTLYLCLQTNKGEVTIPKEISVVGDAAFRDCSAVTKVNMPKGLKRIGGSAFSECSGLTDIQIPESVTEIGSMAFYGCSGLSKVHIPKNVTLLGDTLFYKCDKLNEITVDSKNKNYASKDGILYDKAKQTLIRCPKAKKGEVVIPRSVYVIEEQAFAECAGLTGITVPDSVTEIGIAAFSYCSALKAVKIPSGVTSIGNCTFELCKNLEKISIPTSVASIDYRAFEDCKKLKDVYYEGNEEEWDKIKISDSYNEALENTTIHYESQIEEICLHTSTQVMDFSPAAVSKKGYTGDTVCALCGKVIQKGKTIYAPKTVALSVESVTYNGASRKPSVTVFDSKGKKISSQYYSVVYANHKNVGKAQVTVKLKGNYSGTLTKNFKILPKPTSVSGLNPGKQAFTVKWKKQTTQTTGYQIQYALDRKFKDVEYKNINKNTVTAKTVSGVRGNKTYYVRVRTYKTVREGGKDVKYYSNWSKTKQIVTKK